MNPLQLLRRSANRSRAGQPQAHMTWAHTSVGRTMTRTGLFLKKRLWVWPVIAVVVLSTIGFFVRSAVEATMRANLDSQLKTLLTSETAMLTNWLEVQEADAEAAANDPRVRSALERLLEIKETGPEDGSTESNTVRRDLAKALAPALAAEHFAGFFVVDKSKEILAASHDVLIGKQDVKEYEAFIARALAGETAISPPFASVVMLDDGSGVRTGVPTMYACAPIRDESFLVVGALALQMEPQHKFTQILQLGRMGKSGETYAFDRSGLMVSNSRFDDDLILLGILADHEQSRSILNVMVRDPQGDMTTGFRPTQRRSEMPLTRMAADAVEGNTGSDIDGYRDYRGVKVVGAWTWLPKYNLGVTTEIDAAEAFLPLTILQRTFWSLYGLLVLSAIAIFVFTVVVARMQREAQKAAIEAQQLGQYTLEEKLGAGAMGVVYRGHHAMLRRPTAIKLLDTDKINDASIQRFEREVQITCRLNHPSTIAIYDYGRTPEGVFYYAMEFLDGINLQELVEGYGAQPAGRVIEILLQICGSLYEAHSQGLVHRDIKPANIMLSYRGSEPDIVKVLDFGLVKAIDEQNQSGSGGGAGLTGTPLYMSPEAIQTPLSVDGRSDLYSVGAVAYFLLTGHVVFDANSIVDLCQKHVDEAPIPPTKRTDKPISEELEFAVLSCLEKSRAKRPQTARELAELLRKCPEATTWSLNQADAWWARHGRNQTDPNAPARAKETLTSHPSYDQTMAYDAE